MLLRNYFLQKCAHLHFLVYLNSYLWFLFDVNQLGDQFVYTRVVKNFILLVIMYLYMYTYMYIW